MSMIPGVIYALFIGAWSDKHIAGRKLLMLSGVLTDLIATLLTLLNTIYFDWPASYLLICDVPQALLGGKLITMAAVFSFAAQNTPHEWKTLRFTVLEVVSFAGAPIGTVIANSLVVKTPWFNNLIIRNYIGVFLVAAIVAVISLVWIVFMINETNREDDRTELVVDDKEIKKPENTLAVIKNVFSIEHVKQLFKVVTKKRPNRERTQILSVIVAHNLSMMMFRTSSGLGFVQEAFNWNVIKYNYVNMIQTVFTPIMCMISIYTFTKVVSLSDMQIGLIGALSGVLSLTIQGEFDCITEPLTDH